MTKLNLQVFGLALGLIQAVSAGLAPVPKFDHVKHVSLGKADSFALVAEQSIYNDGTTTVVTGNVAVGGFGTSPAIYGFGPGAGTIIGTLPPQDRTPLANKVYIDAARAYKDAKARTATKTITGNIGNQILTPGVTKWSAGVDSTATYAYLDGTLVLDGLGDPKSIFIIQIPLRLEVGYYSSATVTLTRGAKACNVYWVVAGGVDLYGTVWKGNVLAEGVIYVQYSTVDGGLYSLGNYISIYNSNISKSICHAGKHEHKEKEHGHKEKEHEHEEKDHKWGAEGHEGEEHSKPEWDGEWSDGEHDSDSGKGEDEN
ncbi:hypothetical protein QBC43DRAFT_374255 [Cladorrhinum sp. PSN259]|nr:hypothetical protein QBC43DRAFT_374255 [Cladorrhinum sp. PSN259]